MEILKRKIMIAKIKKKSVDELNSRREETEERINDLEDRR